MSNLVESLSTPHSILEALAKVRAAHAYLVQQGALAVSSAADLPASPLWGTQIKRVPVIFPQSNRPKLIPASIEKHNLTEVYNQCAHMERLIDALEWAARELPGYHVTNCQPTTSSKSNDLVLQNAAGETARFEVSDVVGKKDSNRKQDKELKSLGVLSSGKGEARFQIDRFPIGRLFLVVSTDFAHLLCNRTKVNPKTNPHYYYQKHPVSQWTVIFEVLPAK